MKIDFSKVENIMTESLRKKNIEKFSELAIIVDLIQAPHQAAKPQLVEQIAKNFVKELYALDPIIFSQLDLSPEDEERFKQPPSSYTTQDWLLVKKLKERIEELKSHLIGQEKGDAEMEKEVEQMRKEQVYKRFNIRDGWLPLH